MNFQGLFPYPLLEKLQENILPISEDVNVHQGIRFTPVLARKAAIDFTYDFRESLGRLDNQRKELVKAEKIISQKSWRLYSSLKLSAPHLK